MSTVISGNMVGGGAAPLKTVILEDESGNQFTGVCVDSLQIFDATDNDVREGKTYVSDNGASVGTKTIPSYHTTYGHKVIKSDTEITISVDEFDFSNLFVTITTYNTAVSNSFSATYVAIDGGMYAVGNGEKISDIIADMENEKINLGMTVPEKSVVRYLVTREEF